MTRLVTLGSGGVDVVIAHLVERLGDGGPHGAVPIEQVDETGDGLAMTGSDETIEARLTVRSTGELLDLELEVAWVAERPARAGLRFGVELPGRITAPRWLVPGCFYGENRPQGTAVRYPRAVLSGGDLSEFESSWWSFRSDRAAAPAVFGSTEEACAGLAVDPVTALGMSGLGFAAEPVPRIWADFPYREEPAVYRGDPAPASASVTTYRWRPGERHVLRLLLWLGPPEAHAYRSLVRERYRRDRRTNELRPRMDVAEAAELAASGLLRWHWHPEHDALYETAEFDRTLAERDRPNMHVAWISGIPWAAALLEYGRRSGTVECVDAGARIIDRLCEQLTPAGTFWGEWRRDRGWGCGWNRNPDWLHARTLAEATLFALRAVRSERGRGVERLRWADVAASNLHFAVGCLDDHGDLGAYYHQATGEVIARDGAAGMLWIAALAEGAAVLGEPTLLEAARRAAVHYAGFVEDAFINGAPEDVHLAPTSEDAYNAVIAFMSLYRADRRARWLELAQQAAEWTMTFRWTYNVEFDQLTTLHQHGFRSRGADNASPVNQHLHAYGLVALAELVELWRHTEDRYFLDRARDNLACFLQLVARADGDFTARKGMVAERYHHTDYAAPKGSILTQSHAWCVGVLLHACLVALADPAAFPPGLGWVPDRDEELVLR